MKKKNVKSIVGICLLVQSVSFLILFFMFWKKKKSLSSAFAALSAIGGISGAYLLLSEIKAKKASNADGDDSVFDFDDDSVFDFDDDDFSLDNFDTDDIECSFENELLDASDLIEDTIEEAII